jgi:hypothetical protein
LLREATFTLDIEQRFKNSLPRQRNAVHATAPSTMNTMDLHPFWFKSGLTICLYIKFVKFGG